MMKPDEILKTVNEAIAALPYERQPQSLYNPIKYVLSLGGKRIRPVLMLLSYNLFKDDPERVMNQALALEIYHNFTLLHDDLIDNADLRRGHETVHRRWDVNKAILSGDTMLVTAFERVAMGGCRRLPEVLSLFTQTALEVDEGQEYDMSFETRDDVSEAEYLEMTRLKTSVLLACALKMGAILADAAEADAELLYKCGEHIGLAFQLQDDLLDVYGDPAVFGKAIGGDITENKKTYMLINAFNHADAAQRAELLKWFGKTSFDREEKIAAVTRLYDAIGVRQLCERRIDSYFDEARRDLEQVSVAPERKQYLLQYMNNMMKRES